MLIAARDVVERLPAPDERFIRTALSGNLCRCTGYVGIVRAVRSVIAARRARGIAPEPDGGRKILGPVGSGHARAAAALAAKAPTVSAQPHSVDRARDLVVIPDFTPTARFEQTFIVAHAPEKVFAFLGDIAAVAACLPGAALTAAPSPERVEGAIRVKIGPIAANFIGAARVERDPTNLSGHVVGVGAGADPGGRSSTQGEIRYRLIPIDNGAATRVNFQSDIA
jgi:aerobic carbon-monoxide dehydrogenase small subunit